MRTLTYVISTSLGQEENFGFMPYGQPWRNRRRVFWQHFNPGALQKYKATQREVALVFLKKLRESPERFEDHIR